MSEDAASKQMSHGAAFDSHADDYEAQLSLGLKLSGEPKEFFANGRIDFLCRWWQRAGRREPLRIIDYGCGVGDVTALLAKAFPSAQVEGLDPSPRCVERAFARYASDRVRFELLRGFGSQTRPADLVHLNGVVHHVPPAGRPDLFRAVTASVAPGGVVALFENNPLNPGTHIVMARIKFDRDAVKVPSWEARRRLRVAGLSPVTTGYLFYFPRSLRALRPLEDWLSCLPFGAQYGVIALRSPA